MARAQPIERYLDESSDRPLLRIDVPASLSTSSFQNGLPTKYSSPQSASSVATSLRSSASDGESQISSAPTSATSITIPSMGTIEPSYWLQCPFREIECKVQFYPEDFETWQSHCLSHWIGHPPPRDCLCIFCDKPFRGSNGWRKRMTHIAGHLANGFRVEESRPDFAVYRYEHEKGLLAESDFEALMKYSECPSNDLGLVPSDYQPENPPAFRDDVVLYDQRKEDRERKGSHRSKGKGRESRHHHHRH